MMPPRPFRFGVLSSHAPSRQAWIDYARKVEDLGYSTLAAPDHIYFGGLAPLLALMAAADATTTLRLATHVLANDFRNPVILAQEVATLDLLSEGRLEFGIGAGWLASDYAAAGIPFDAAATRLRRLEEAVPLLKRLLTNEPVTCAGDYYAIKGMTLQTTTVQRPHPPFYIGGGGKRVLSLAAREADIVGLNSKATPAGAVDLATRTAEAFERKVRWVRDAAGDRFPALELHALVQQVIVTDDRRRGAEQLLSWAASFPPDMVTNTPRTMEEILDAPYCLTGTVEQIAEQFRERRERYGVSYVTINGALVDVFAPVVKLLAGT